MNDLKNASNILEPIIFAHDINLYFTHEDIEYLFQIVNQELESINQWFIRWFITRYKTKNKTQKHSFFHKLSQKENIPLLLPKLIIRNSKIQRTESIKFVFLEGGGGGGWGGWGRVIG